MSPFQVEPYHPKLVSLCSGQRSYVSNGLLNCQHQV